MNAPAFREIWCTLAGQIDQTMVQRVFQFFANATRDRVEKVHLLIQSMGGFVGDGVVLYNYLRGLPISITTYNAGNVSSIAVTVFLAGSHRVSAEDATFMIHKSHASPNPGQTASMLKEVADSLDIDNARTEAILRKHLSLPDEKWILLENRNLTITAQEAMQFVLIHEHGLFSPPPNAQLFNI